jgi:O-antigen/teichoic acid export membrane protein
MARILGPEKLAPFTYLYWLTNVGSQLAMAGLPVTTRKYLADYLGIGDLGTAWHVFLRSLRLQIYLALALVVAGGAWMFWAVPRNLLAIGLILLLSMVPKLIACILSAANFAGEQVKMNTVGAVAGNAVGIILTNVSLFAGWDLLGVAISTLLGTVVELILKSVYTLKWLKPTPGELPPGLNRRMLKFSGQSLVVLILNLVIWDRSDLFFLKWLDKDIRQIAFFALAFNLADKILMLPRSFTSALGISVMAEYGRDRQRAYKVASNACKYAFLVTVPVMFGLGAVADPLIRLLYGKQYLPVIPVLMVSALFSCAKPLLAPVQNLLFAEERQKVLIGWSIPAGALNIGLDIALIPLAGALGAMFANGSAQAITIIGFWGIAAWRSPLRLPLRECGGILLAGTLMTATVYGVCMAPVPAILRLVLGVPLGVVIYMVMIRLARVLNEEDEKRVAQIFSRLPGPARTWTDRLLAFMIASPRAAVTSS